jgi:hypothetical protein
MAELDVDPAIWEEMAKLSSMFMASKQRDPVVEWRARHGRFIGSACGHDCTPTCTLDPICKDTFGCVSTGAVHKCGIDECKASILAQDGHFVCGLTGYELGRVFMHEWSARISGDIETNGDTVKTLGRVQFKKKRSASSRTRRCSAREVISSVLSRVLQNPVEGELVEKKWEAALTTIKRSTQAYAQECMARGEYPSMVVVEDMAQRQMIRARLWQRERCGDDRRMFYVDVICQLWDTVAQIMARNRTETHIQIFALGCLYKLQHGFDVHGNRVLPADEWLSWNLPLASDIGAYGYPKRFITVGRTTLLEAFKHLVQTKRLKATDLTITRAEKRTRVCM